MNISHLLSHHFNNVLPTHPLTHIAVAVSGGADSLALCLLLNEWTKHHQLTLTALTVDHQLRPESHAEALQVQEWLTVHGIVHKTLVWKHEAINSSIQENARNARYTLMIDYCKQHDIQHLCLGHHQHDQWETFFMRLSHASGLKGLAGMRFHTQRAGVNIYRPLLNTPPHLLKQYLESIGQFWIEDPSNHMDKYERVRWRQHIAHLSELGLSPNTLQSVCEKLSADDQAIDWAAQNWIKTHCKFNTQLKFTTASLNIKQLPLSLIRRIALGVASQVVGLPIASSDVRHNMDSLVQKLTAHSFKPFTFGGCYWTEHQNTLYIMREWSKCPKHLITEPNMTYDHRFMLTDLPVGKTLEPLSKTHWSLMKSMVHPAPFPHQVFLSLPVIVEHNQIVWQDLLM